MNAARKLRRQEKRNLLAQWARDLGHRGYNTKYATLVRDAAYALFTQSHHDELRDGKLSAHDVFAAGFDAGIRSIEFVHTDAVQDGLPQELVRDAQEHYEEIERRSPFPLGLAP